MAIDKAKVVVAGDACTGKTALIARFLYNLFSPDYNFTVGIDYHSKDVTLASGSSLRLQLWDTAGQERFKALIPSYMKSSHAVILAYSTIDHKSFESLPFWLNFIQLNAPTDCPIILVATKCDLPNLRTVSPQEASLFASRHHLVHIETSAITGSGVNDVFHNATFLASESLHLPVQSPVTSQLALESESMEGSSRCCHIF